jgi:hypothetical protein
LFFFFFRGGLGEQLKVSGFEATVHYFALHFGLTDGIAKAVVSMGIAVVVNLGAVYKVGFAIDAYSEVAIGAFELKLALAAGCIDQQYFFTLIGLGCFVVFILGRSA